MQYAENKEIQEEIKETEVKENTATKDNAVKEVMILDDRTLQNRLYVIRGQKVMLDYDLAEIYGYTTKALNQQVKRNLEKFPDDFMFQVELSEIVNSVRSQFVASRGNGLFMGQSGGLRYLPYAFTEQRIYMLMTVLKGPLAVEQSKTLIRLFKQMKDCFIENRDMFGVKRTDSAVN